MPLFTSGGLGLGLVSSGLGLVILVLVLRIWSCLHHWVIGLYDAFASLKHVSSFAITRVVIAR